MKKQQFILVSCGILLLISLFFFGKTTPSASAKKEMPAQPLQGRAERVIDNEKLLAHAKERLSLSQQQYITQLENTVKRGDVKAQQIAVYKQLATFWADSVKLFEPYIYYTAQAAKLENKEKSLTFAAHLLLNNLKTEPEPAMQHWLATNAKDLFSQALQLNPTNDSSKIGLGACYIFGNLSDNPMEGIGLVREVVQRNPANIFGQLVLGLGGIKSGQYDKAIERFKNVLDKQPANLEAMLNLAEVYDRKSEKSEAILWYKKVNSMVDNADAKKELEQRIKALQ